MLGVLVGTGCPSAMPCMLGNAVDALDDGDALVTYVGPRRSGDLLEAGVMDWHGHVAVVHAIRARPSLVCEVTAMPRSIDDLIARGDELAEQFEGYEPSPEGRREPPLMTIRRLGYQRSLLERELLAAVGAARSAGVAWSKIGRELGTSGEAARQRYADRIKEPSGPRP